MTNHQLLASLYEHFKHKEHNTKKKLLHAGVLKDDPRVKSANQAQSNTVVVVTPDHKHN